jgi:hypothetical protein
MDNRCPEGECLRAGDRHGDGGERGSPSVRDAACVRDLGRPHPQPHRLNT